MVAKEERRIKRVANQNEELKKILGSLEIVYKITTPEREHGGRVVPAVLINNY